MADDAEFEDVAGFMVESDVDVEVLGCAFPDFVIDVCDDVAVSESCGKCDASFR